MRHNTTKTTPPRSCTELLDRTSAGDSSVNQNCKTVKHPCGEFVDIKELGNRWRKTHIYIAGKISQSDFRHTVVQGLRNHHWGDGFLETKDYTYTGPFFRSCDHGCCHGPNTHGAAEGCTEEYSPKDEILARNNHALDSSDLVLVYVTQPDCYGTLVEIGRAAAKQKRIVIAFSPDFKQTDDFWYAVGSADFVYDDVHPCCLPLILAREVDRLNQRVTEVVA